MAKTGITKRILIDKANSRVVVFTSVAAFIFIFSLVATKTLISQAAYQNRVIGAKKVAVHQLNDNVQATTKLRSSYEAFVNTSQNVLGGSTTDDTSQQGDNAKIILDALPSTYDFPALATSLDSLLTSDGLEIQNISGIDDEIAQSGTTASGTPAPVPMPFQATVAGDYDSIKKLVSQFERSIRPFQMQKVTISGTSGKLSLSVEAQTFYQPGKTFSLGSKVVK